jgi:predicted dehydrogenase
MTLSRRGFLATSAAAASLAFDRPASARVMGANERVRVAAIGTSRSNSGKNPGQGATLAINTAQLQGAEVAVVCDVDDVHMKACAADVAAKQARPPAMEKDLRKVLENKDVDAVTIGTPDHWHAPAAILAMAAGKHVYCEKPCSHNPREGELLVEAARKHKRVVQHGTQRRSWPSHVEAIQRLREGEIGRILNAKCFYIGSDRPTIGRGKAAPVPEKLDWALWQGPAPERDYKDNVVHYNWHWFWHWGTAELGNNGVHSIDVARWGLGVDVPLRVTSSGLHQRFDDDQETPDTHVAAFTFANNTQITWEGRSWGGRRPGDPAYQIGFFGDRGTLLISGGGYVMHDLQDRELAKSAAGGDTKIHLQNWLDAIRGGAKLNAEIEEGFKSTMLCHLGNIAVRTGKTLTVDPATRKPAPDKEVEALWSREYRPGWEPKV